MTMKKSLAVAAVAASLGVSLGVAVEDVLAAGEKMDSPPAHNLQDRKTIASEQMKAPDSKVSNQLKIKVDATSGKFKPGARQIK